MLHCYILYKDMKHFHASALADNTLAWRHSQNRLWTTADTFINIVVTRGLEFLILWETSCSCLDQNSKHMYTCTRIDVDTVGM